MIFYIGLCVIVLWQHRQRIGSKRSSSSSVAVPLVEDEAMAVEVDFEFETFFEVFVKMSSVFVFIL